MSNILIIKHGSLGDIAQASGAIQDISDFYKDDKIYLLTSKPYIDLFKQNPHLTGTILDKRLSRFNLIYLFNLMRKLKKYKFIKVFDLQNSSRSSFYKKILFPNAGNLIWSSSETTLPNDKSKDEFDKNPVLDRFKHQLKTSGVKIQHTMFPDFKWACSNIENIKKKFDDEYKIVVAPGAKEIDMTKEINAITILNQNNSLNIQELSSLIKDSTFVISNDTGPAHMTSHLGVKGVALFGSHTTAHKVSIERENFKAIQVTDLNKLSPEKVFEYFLQSLN